MPSNFRSMPASVRNAVNSFRARPDMLDNRHFFAALGIAFVLHIFALYVWYLMPNTPVLDIPVRALNIKLGDGDEISPQEARPQAPAPVPENAVSRLVHDDTQEVQQREQDMTHSMDKLMGNFEKMPVAPPAPAKPVPPAPQTRGRAKVVGQFSVRNEANATAAPVMSVVAKQFVRDTGTTSKGDTSGNSNAHDAEMISRYEQLISLWIQKFKVYPDDARAQGMQGDTMVRIRIDRHGSIHYYELEHSTGHDVLDKAAIDMIRRANPVPAVPTDYPQGELLEFLIPVNYQLQ